jgi:hypothetical protein
MSETAAKRKANSCEGASRHPVARGGKPFPSYGLQLSGSSGENGARWPVSKLEAEGRTGCLITGPASSWLVLLRPDGTRSDREVRLQVPGPNPCRALVTDLTPGRWRAERVGAAGTFDVEVTAEAGAAWLEAEAGAWTLRR